MSGARELGGLAALRAALVTMREPVLIGGTLVAVVMYAMLLGLGCFASASLGVPGALGREVSVPLFFSSLVATAFGRNLVAVAHRSWVVALADDVSRSAARRVWRRGRVVASVVIVQSAIDVMLVVMSVVVWAFMFDTAGFVVAVVFVGLGWLASRAALGLLVARATLGEDGLVAALREGVRMARAHRLALLVPRITLLALAATLIVLVEGAAWATAERFDFPIVDLLTTLGVVLIPFAVGGYAATLDALVEARMHEQLVRVDAQALASQFD